MALHGDDHARMVADRAGVATPRTVWKTEDGIEDCRGTTVPTDASEGYAPGCDFRDITNGAKYINEGTKASADFNKVLTTTQASTIVSQVDASELSGTAAGTGPSPLIWDGSEWLQTLLDPTDRFGYFNDFMGEIDVTSADGWTLTQVDTKGSIYGDPAAAGGVIIFSSATGDSADDGLNAQLKNCMVKPAAGVTIRFEARVKVSDATQQWFFGLAGADTTLIASGVLDDVVDKAGFFHHAAGTDDKVSSVVSRTSTEDITADVADVVDDTWMKIGFVLDGLTSVKFYVNGVLVETGTTTAALPNAVMCLSAVAQYESADELLSVDWVRILSEGGRDA